MNRRAVIEWVKIIGVSTFIVGYITFLATRPSYAENPNSVEQRQARALEKIASEMEQMRRCQCKR
jgi:hypothetical protein